MKTYAEFLAGIFEGKIQKLPIDTQRGCPNRHGTLGRGGCTYCLNAAFSPDAAKSRLTVKEQIERGRRFFARKYREMRYLAYFQSYTPTFADADEFLRECAEAMDEEDVAGVVVSTRPDCLPDSLIDGLRGLRKRVIIEIGAESTHDATLRRVNRCHTWERSVDAVRRCHEAGLPVGLHLIMGLPGETEEMMLESVRRVNELPIATIKFHHLQILRGTALGAAYERGEELDRVEFTPESYAALCRRILGILRPDIAVERFLAESPLPLILTPRWGLKPQDFKRTLEGM